MSRKLLSLSLSLSVSAALFGTVAMADAPKVAADIAPVHGLVARVMQGVGSPDLIVPKGESPHGFAMRPSSAAALQDADLVFWIGEGLTPQLHDAIETLAAGALVTSLIEADGAKLLERRENALFEKHKHGEDEGHDEHGHDEHKHDDHGHDDHAEHKDNDHGHAEHDDHGHAEHDDHDDHAHHGAHDPHVWLSVQNASVWLNVIAAELSKADPDNAGAYFTNAAAARAEMETLSKEVMAKLDPVRGARFIVFHDAYQYFEDDFNFSAAGAISIGDASDPGPARIAEIQGRIQNEGVDCVLSEPQFNPGLVATVLDGTKANTVVSDPLGSSLELGAALYPQLIRDLSNTLVECLSDG
jgi:zinc transport system substrate-binding protein